MHPWSEVPVRSVSQVTPNNPELFTTSVKPVNNMLMLKFKLNRQGFTLVELMVTVAIIAILVVTGVSFFGNAQKSARDSKRQIEVIAISKAIESNKPQIGYGPVLSSYFANNVYPGNDAARALDPSGYPYCISSNNTNTIIADPDPETLATWKASPITCPSPYTLINNTTPATGDTNWKVCALLEANNSTTTFCKASTQ